jgi:hypothetical protein
MRSSRRVSWPAARINAYPCNKFGVIMRIRASISEMKNVRPPPQAQLTFTDDMTLTFRH